MSKTIAIFGADGATGLHASAQALDRGWSVRALTTDGDHPLGDRDALETRKIDVLTDDLGPALQGCDAVLSCLGIGNDLATLADPPPLYTKGTAAICDAMVSTGIRRLVVISATFVEEANRGPIWFQLPARMGLSRVFAQMGEMEEYLRAQEEIDWTAVRPGWLMEGEITRDYRVQTDAIPEDTIRTRHADLAHFMLELVGSDDWVRQTPAIARAEDASASSPYAVLKEFAA